MIKIKKLFALLISMAALTAGFTACGDEEEAGKTTANKTAIEDIAKDSENVPALEDLDEPSKATGKIANFTAPEKGETVVVMTIKDYGEVKIKLFPDQAPAGAANFAALADKGYYDNLIFHRIINKFMIQGGDPMGTGIGGESIWGGKFDGGTHADLIHLPGAVCYANSGATSTNGSQFYIVTGDAVDATYLTQLKDYGYSFTDEAIELYSELGGTPHLDGAYTVFGQVYDGLDIVNKIQSVATGEGDKPVEDVVIESVKLAKYDGEDVKFKLSDYE